MGKTRIIGRANLNEASFERYALLALSEGLLTRVERGFRITPLGEVWVGAANRVLTKQVEFQRALDDLARLRAPNEGQTAPGPLDPAELSTLRLPTFLHGVELSLGSTGISGGHGATTLSRSGAAPASPTGALGATSPAPASSVHRRSGRDRTGIEGTSFDARLPPK